MLRQSKGQSAVAVIAAGQEANRPDNGADALAPAAAAAGLGKAAAASTGQHALPTSIMNGSQSQVADQPPQQQASLEHHQLGTAVAAPTPSGQAATKEGGRKASNDQSLGRLAAAASTATAGAARQAASVAMEAATQPQQQQQQQPQQQEQRNGPPPPKRRRSSSSSSSSSSAKGGSSEPQQETETLADNMEQQQDGAETGQGQAEGQQEQSEEDLEQGQEDEDDNLELETAVPHLPSLPALLLADNPNTSAGEDAISRRTRSRLPLGPVSFDPTEFDRVLAEFDPDVEMLVDDDMYAEFLQVGQIVKVEDLAVESTIAVNHRKAAVGHSVLLHVPIRGKLTASAAVQALLLQAGTRVVVCCVISVHNCDQAAMHLVEERESEKRARNMHQCS